VNAGGSDVHVADEGADLGGPSTAGPAQRMVVGFSAGIRVIRPSPLEGRRPVPRPRADEREHSSNRSRSARPAASSDRPSARTATRIAVYVPSVDQRR
jgi:hypothetical protein